MAEVKARFGGFQRSDRRPNLFARLEEFALAMKGSGLFSGLIIDGSFVTDKPAPNDIDIVALLRPNLNFERDLPMFNTRCSRGRCFGGDPGLTR